MNPSRRSFLKAGVAAAAAPLLMKAAGVLPTAPYAKPPIALSSVYGPLNVRDFGAYGDGCTDDTEAFKAAMEYAKGHGVPLFVPTGVYNVDHRQIPILDGIRVIGETA